MRAPTTKKKNRGKHQEQASRDDEEMDNACSKPPSNVRAVGARRLVRVGKKKEKETQQKEKHQTTNKENTTTDHGKTMV